MIAAIVLLPNVGKTQADRLQGAPWTDALLAAYSRHYTAGSKPDTGEALEQPEWDVSDPDIEEPESEDGLGGLLPEKLRDYVNLGFLVEVESFYERSKPHAEKIDKSGDLEISSVELAVDVQATEQFGGHVLFEWAKNECAKTSEAFIHFRSDPAGRPDGPLDIRWYASAGKMVLPFGYYESIFIGSPMTQDLGEATAKGGIVGVYHDWWNAAAGIFNGKVNETGHDRILNGYVGVARLILPEDAVSGVHMQIGASYTSNIAHSDELDGFVEEAFESNTVADGVPGFGGFLTLSWQERCYLEAEYVAALKSFKEDAAFEPAAWSFEFALRPMDPLKVGLRYGGSHRSLDFLPTTQYGICAVLALGDHITVAVEYLTETFDNNDEANRFTSQVTLEF